MLRIIIFSLIILASCGGVDAIKYTPTTMKLKDATDTVEELIMTQHPLWKPDSLEINDKYISWDFGYISKGKGTAIAVAPGFAVGRNSSVSNNKNERVYFHSIKDVQLSTWSRKFETWYVVSLIDKNGDIFKHILHTRDLDDAKRFTDAINTLAYH